MKILIKGNPIEKTYVGQCPYCDSVVEFDHEDFIKNGGLVEFDCPVCNAHKAIKPSKKIQINELGEP